MKFRKVLIALLTLLATLGVAGPTPAGAVANATGFYEIHNGTEELVFWQRGTNGGYTRQLIGPGWGDTRLIAGLSTTQLLQIRVDGTLWDWKVDPADGKWKGYYVSPNWENVTQLAGIGTDRFLALTSGGVLTEYWSPSSNHAYSVQGTWPVWGNHRLIAGLSYSRIFGITNSGDANRFTRDAGGWSGAYVGPDWDNVRLIAGIDTTRLVTARTDGVLVEWNNTTANTWTPTIIGGGWNNTRLLG
ncbi:hypothetical protein [Actinokineospora inagensis]|uniref:hypothetical protein n=1 Tax=Actinokineospora inagensis TaxID=103730 RepID=UPI00040B7428|nr:hypothetical protein [Actinokineospora inagensis]